MRGLKFTLAAVLAGLIVVTAMPARALETERRYLSGRDADSAVKWDFFCTAGRGSGAWTKIAVPSCWETQGFGSYDYGHRKLELGGTALDEQGKYRCNFTLPGDWKGRRVFLVFDGVMTDAEVKVNGAATGPVHQGAFYRFKYDITPLVKIGWFKRNTLEVTVSKESASAAVNRAERHGDYWNFGGIFRPVYLEALPTQYIERVAIDARHDGSFAMDFVLGGQGPATQVEVTILDPSGKPTGASATADAGTGRLTKTVYNILPWTAETPVLYTAQITLKKGDISLHEIRQRFGFRTVEVRPRDGIYVNGKRVMLKGTDRHSFWPTTGRALSERVHRMDIAMMKEMNMNAVRMSHYPPDERFLELCDELGLYVLDELAGWQKGYNDTALGQGLVRAMVTRDVNHPCILCWDNGNEGGWNRELDGEFAKWDPQQRNVLHPWELFGDINTKHYPRYNELVKLLDKGDIVMPTELLHGLYDGGHGAGLADTWDLMLKYKNAAGGFLWSLVDEGVVRTDLNGAIDVQGNQGPDGILGPYRQKEGSFYAVRELWSPIHINRVFPKYFDGSFAIENRFSFTSLGRCGFEWQLRRFTEKPGYKVAVKGVANSPEVAPGTSGTLQLELPMNFRAYDALALTATDPAGREVWTWVWPLKTAKQVAERMLPRGNDAESKVVAGDAVTIASGPARLKVNTQTGALLSTSVGGKPFALTSGPIRQATWSQLEGGWFKLTFAGDPADAPAGEIGAAFNYPEKQMLKKTWLGEGTYRVWRNRLAGGVMGVWETEYNETQTGYKDWVYPEFAGYFAGVRWMKIKTTEGTLTILNPDDKAFVRVGTPAQPEKKLRAKTDVTFPEANLAVVREIPPIGNKFHNAADTGPMAATPLCAAPYQSTLYLKLER